jgi:hypothetical protein
MADNTLDNHKVKDGVYVKIYLTFLSQVRLIALLN